jgi:hypothetical protein
MDHRDPTMQGNFGYLIDAMTRRMQQAGWRTV